MLPEVDEQVRHLEEVLAFVRKDEEALHFRTDHDACKNNAIWRHDRKTTWYQNPDYEGWVIDGRCPGCQRLYRMHLSRVLLMEAKLA